MGIPLNPAQKAAVEHGAGPALVLAGAGSGKTQVAVAIVITDDRCIACGAKLN